MKFLRHIAIINSYNVSVCKLFYNGGQITTLLRVVQNTQERCSTETYRKFSTFPNIPPRQVPNTSHGAATRRPTPRKPVLQKAIDVIKKATSHDNKSLEKFFGHINQMRRRGDKRQLSLIFGCAGYKKSWKHREIC